MITDKELNEVSLSPTKKDYYQIWNELIDYAAKISARWSPESTNESDPGIVLLKALVAIADKLNYNIDKNTLEAFMPSATQAESMRKLTEMMGYSMKYYQAATCKVTITYKDSNETTLKTLGSIYFPKFVNLKNEEEDRNFVTLEEFTLQESEPARTVAAIEGELVECETDNDNIISMIHLDDNNRYMLPEVNIAENGIFVFNINDSTESELWKQVSNLNVQLPGTPVFKFGFDSAENLPYLQFPDDISQLIHDGLRIRYIRTNGLSGNIAARTLVKLEPPAIWSTAEDENIKALSADNFSVINTSAATNGADPESLTAAYNNYKKTIGTFDTLVTCRDYMNKIYQMTVSDTDTTPLVSNVIVSDIRDDINRSSILCSFNDYGISYTDCSFDGVLGREIEHFDLLLYPFKTIYGLNTKEEYINSFKCNTENEAEIYYELEDNKTIAHNFVPPKDDEIACIKNYLRLKARITTVKKVTSTEEAAILRNIYKAIYKNFNNRNIDFGEEIPYDTILDVIETADTRIKDVSLDEPTLYTKIATVGGAEHELVTTGERTSTALTDADKYYNKLVLRNVLAGRIAAFQYNNNFKTGYDELSYGTGTDPVESKSVTYKTNYPVAGSDLYISNMSSEFKVQASNVPAGGLTLKENEVIQFRLPNFRTITTYPCYVNYFIKLDTANKRGHVAIPATFMTLRSFLLYEDQTTNKTRLDNLANSTTFRTAISKLEGTEKITSESQYNTAKNYYGALYTWDGSRYVKSMVYDSSAEYYALVFNSSSFITVFRYIQTFTINDVQLQGIYKSLGASMDYLEGAMVDVNHVKYQKAVSYGGGTSNPLDIYYVQETHSTNEEDYKSGRCTTDGLGVNADYPTVGIDSEYQLSSGEYLLINYTDSTTDSAGNEQKTVINKYYGEGTIIKPNFAITDSELYHKNHTYSKKDGFYFEEKPKTEGMFTLGTNEQICIRDIVKVELDEDGTNLYWELNSDDPDLLTNEFVFNEPDLEGNANMAYTLKEGEHLYYTDSKKNDIAFYGAGTLVIRHANTPKLTKKTTDGTISEEDIMTYGLAANIPWNAFRLSTPYSSITIIENQYISLTEGDTLKYISDVKGAESKTINTFAVDLDNDWVKTTAAVYKFAEAETESYLPEVKVGNMNWAVRSRLDFNLGPITPQTLNSGDSIKLSFKYRSSNRDAQTLVLRPLIHSGKTAVTPLTIYSNYVCQCAYDSVDTSGKYFRDLGVDYDFKLKLATLSAPVILGEASGDTGGILALDNYVNGDAYFTKFSFESLPIKTPTIRTTPAFTLNINIPSTDKCGLIMIHYKDDNAAKVASHVNAKIVATGGKIGPFNKADRTWAATYTLVPGIQVIELEKTVKTLSFYSDYDSTGTADDPKTGSQSTIIFSDLSIVTDINPKLDYRFDSNDETGNTTGYAKLLADIAASGIADKFYYNAPIDNSNAIELNTNVDADKLSSPAAWYDPNNVNNKFVISEIDAEYLTTGIVLTKASRM